jgi:uncharacterized Zn-binding protein involved in type VI secretion
MPYILTTGSTVQCIHGGNVTLKTSQTKLKVDGQPALVSLDLVNASIPDCPVKPAPGVAPCLAITSVITGTATTVIINGEPVLLDTATGLTNGVPQPTTWSVISAGQSTFQAQ